jgi:hypothetical protein
VSCTVHDSELCRTYTANSKNDVLQTLNHWACRVWGVDKTWTPSGPHSGSLSGPFKNQKKTCKLRKHYIRSCKQSIPNLHLLRWLQQWPIIRPQRHGLFAINWKPIFVDIFCCKCSGVNCWFIATRHYIWQCHYTAFYKVTKTTCSLLKVLLPIQKNMKQENQCSKVFLIRITMLPSNALALMYEII